MKTNRVAEAFLESIRANPDDDTPRLVYADWLDENGDAPRAEFIRVQCAKARLPRWHRDYSLLAWRERVLRVRHEHQWLAELPTIKGVGWGNFVRGFVQEVRVLAPAMLSQRAKEIQRAAPVDRAVVACESDTSEGWHNCAAVDFLSALRLEGFTYDLFDVPDAFFQSPLLSTVRALDLSHLNLEGDHFAALARSPHLTNVTTLLLNDCFMGGGNLRLFAESAHFRNLTVLSLQGNPGGYHDDARIRPDDVALLAASPNLARLQTLNLAGNEVDTPSLARLLASPNLHNLRELDVSRNRLSAKEFKPLAGLDTAMRLRRLALSQNAIANIGVEALAEASFCRELADLDLDTCEITPKGMEALAKAPWLRQLGRLNLNHNCAGADGIHALAKALDSGELFALHLRDNVLTTEAVKLLAEAPGLRGLVLLELSENTLDDVALLALASSPHLTQLRVLHLDNCLLERESMRRLCRAPWLKQLVRLSLSNNLIGCDGLSALLAESGLASVNELALHRCDLKVPALEALAAAALKELHWLDLSHNHFHAEGVANLACSPLRTRLVELNLNDNDICDNGAAALAMGEWPLLERLQLESNNLTDKGLQELAVWERFPRLREVCCRKNRIRWNVVRDGRFRAR